MVASRYLQLTLLAVVAVHSLALEQPSDATEIHALGDTAGEYTGVRGKRVEGFAPSAVIPKGLVVLRWAQSSKEQCSEACNEDSKCVGFKYGGGGCAIMGHPSEMPTPKRLKDLPADQSPEFKKMVGAKDKFYNRDQKDMAKALLTSMIPKMSSSDLEKTQEDAARKEAAPIPTTPRDPKKAAPRARKQLIRIAEYNLKRKYLLQAQKNLPAKVKKDIATELRELPGDTKPGSQQQLLNEKIRSEWIATKTAMRDGVRDKVEAFKRDKLDILQLKLFKDLGVDDAMRQLNAQEEKAADAFQAVSAWKLGRENLGNDAIASSTASLKADNLPNCDELKPMCKKDIRIRRQCPHSCRFLQDEKQEAVDRLVEAEKSIAKRRERKAAKENKEYDVREDRLLGQKTKLAEDKEKNVKLKLKERKLQKELGIVPVETNVKFSSDPVVEKQQKLDIKSKGLTNQAMLLRNQATKEVREGQKVLSKEDENAKKQAETIQKSKAHNEVTKIVNGKPVAVAPDPVGNVIKAKAQGQQIEGELNKAVTLIKDGEKKMKQSKLLLKQALAFSKGELVKPKPVKPMPEVNDDVIKNIRKKIAMMTMKRQMTSSKDERVSLKQDIDKLKKKIKGIMKGGSEFDTRLGESNENLADAKKMYHAMTSPEKYISFDNEQQCNYSPPAGCGCSADIQGAQSDPTRRRLLADPNPNTAQPHNGNGDQTVLSGCPNMPAECHCERAREFDSTSLIQELESKDEVDDDFSELGEDLENMFQGIVCRVRTAIVVAKVENPQLLSSVENGPVFKKYKKELAPLLSCVQNSANTDSKCANTIAGLMGDAGEVMPAVKDLQHKLGAKYHRAVKKTCSGS